MARQGKSTNDEVSFADVMLEKRCRKAQNVFLNQVDRLIDWRPIRTLINKKYTKRQNAAGVEKPLNFAPFGQVEFAPVGHNMIAPCKVLVQGSILFYPFRYSGFS